MIDRHTFDGSLFDKSLHVYSGKINSHSACTNLDAPRLSNVYDNDFIHLYLCIILLAKIMYICTQYVRTDGFCK